MTVRVTAGLRAVQFVAARPDPTAPLAAGAIARGLGLSLSSVSRLCAELVDTGLLERASTYGAYRLGRRAIELSGCAQAPIVGTVRAALTRITQETGETSLVAAAAPGGMVITAAVGSPWTLYSPAVVGEVIEDPRSAIVRAAAAEERAVAAVIEDVRGKSVEVAVPLLEPDGATVAVLAVRLPANRAKQGVANARRVLTMARRAIERRLQTVSGAPPEVPPVPEGASALTAAVAVLAMLAHGPATIADIARATGLRRDRVQRLVASCSRAGVVESTSDGDEVRLGWLVHGWLRAAATPTLLAEGTALVSRAADATGACAFITVLRGMRSVTLVEELRDQGEGLAMTSWLGRPCPITSADGGPALVMDFPDDDIRAFLPQRADAREGADFLERVAFVSTHGVIAKESFEEAGQTAVSAPVRDASGAVVAAACLVGATDLLKPKIPELERVTRALAADLSRLVGGHAA